jgi:hypothetical protein
MFHILVLWNSVGGVGMAKTVVEKLLRLSARLPSAAQISDFSDSQRRSCPRAPINIVIELIVAFLVAAGTVAIIHISPRKEQATHAWKFLHFMNSFTPKAKMRLNNVAQPKKRDPLWCRSGS